MNELGAQPGETWDRLVGEWRILQLKEGHRFSTDDIVTSWRAADAVPEARRVLDLGSGIGSVGLVTLGLLGHPDARLWGIEAQEVSVGLARRTAALNGIADRVTFLQGDLRDEALLAGETFPLITGSPPYVPPGGGVVSMHPQKAACRHELRGSVFAYCEAARRFLAKDGRFAFVMWAADPRTEEAPVAAGLKVIERWDYVFREGKAPLIATLVCARAEDDAPARTEHTVTIRDHTGAWTAEYQAFRNRMGFFHPTWAPGPPETPAAG